MKLKALMVLAGLAAGLPQAQAALTRFGDSSVFSSALIAGSQLTETFDGLDADDEPRYAPVNGSIGAGVRLFGENAGSGIATLQGGGKTTSGTSGGRAPISGQVYLDGDTAPFTITFDTAVKAFGFGGSDIGDFIGSGECTDDTCTGGSGPVLNILINFSEMISLGLMDSVNGCSQAGSMQLSCDILGGRKDGNVLFWGLASTSSAAITSVTFTNLTAAATAGLLDGQAFDDFTIGDVRVCDANCGGGGGGQTPEPGALALAGLGLLTAGIARRRRAKR